MALVADMFFRSVERYIHRHSAPASARHDSRSHKWAILVLPTRQGIPRYPPT